MDSPGAATHTMAFPKLENKNAYPGRSWKPHPSHRFAAPPDKRVTVDPGHRSPPTQRRSRPAAGIIEGVLQLQELVLVSKLMLITLAPFCTP